MNSKIAFFSVAWENILPLAAQGYGRIINYIFRKTVQESHIKK
ncbi:MAG: hypothetical protein QXZ44_04690 [Ferroplasma sp.]